MRKKPKKVMIYGRRVPVKEADLEAHGFMGLYHGQSKEIVISNKIKKEDYVSTLLHEMGHALFHRCGLGQTISPELEEVVVEQFSHMILENFNLSLKGAK